MAYRPPRWLPGYTLDQLDDAQARYDLTFPSDLVAELHDRRLEGGYDWSTENDDIRGMLAWPFDMLRFDIEHGAWWPDWGVRPEDMAACEEILRSALAAAPKLIPILGHRFLPASPVEPGNPVISMHGFDTIYYGADLIDYFSRELGSRERRGSMSPVRKARHVPFWSDIVDRWDEIFPIAR